MNRRIERNKYLDKLIRKIGNGSIKIITGIRRSGKSYLLNEIFYEYLLKNDTDDEHIIRFSFDSALDLKKIGEDLIDLKIKRKQVSYRSFVDYVESKTPEDGITFLLLDEVQNLEGFEFVLNGFLETHRYEIFVTGSNSKFLSSDVITEFRGRGDEVHLFPLSFSEYYSSVDSDYQKALSDYAVFGGMPAVALMDEYDEKSKYLKNLFKTTYLRDVIDRYDIRNTDVLDDLLNIISSSISSLINPSKLAKTFKSVKNISLCESTIAKYIDYFEECFLLNKAFRFNVKGKKYISTPFKIYFEDIGLRNARLNFRQIEMTHIMENLVYNELKARGFEVDVGAVAIRENVENRDVKTFLEVDFIASSGSLKYYIQSAYNISDSQKKAQVTKPFELIHDSFKKIIITDDCLMTHYDENGYLILKLEDFLLDEDSLRF